MREVYRAHHCAASRRVVAPTSTLEVGVAFEALVVELEEGLAFGEGEALLLAGGFDVEAHGALEVFVVVLDVLEDLLDGVALDDLVNLPLALVVDGQVDRVRVSEQVVQVAQDLLVGPE